MLAGLWAAEDTVDTVQEDDYATPSSLSANKTNVYDSSIQMFVFIKNSIKRCTTLTTGQTFLSLSHEFRNSLRKYADSLKSKGSSVGRSANAETSLCYLINTAEYCADVVPRLEGMVKSKIREDLADGVDYTADVDLFMDLVVDFISALASVLLVRLEGSFKAMSNTGWNTLTQVGEESAYLLQMQTVLSDAVSKIWPILSEVYFKNLCSKVAHEILYKYLDIVMKQKALSELATQQLLLDTYSLRTLILSMPKLGQSVSHDAAAANSSYGKVVTSRINQIEMVLKLIGTPLSALVDRFVSLFPDGTIADLQAIMSTKGVKKPEQQSTIDAYQASNPPLKSAPPVASSNSDSFPMLIPIGALNSADQRSNFNIPASMAAMRLTTDLSAFAVGNLKWNSAK